MKPRHHVSSFFTGIMNRSLWGKHRFLVSGAICLAVLSPWNCMGAPLASGGEFIGPDGPGAATALAAAPSNPRIVYAAFRAAGVYRGADGGRSFSACPMVNPFTTCTATCLAVHPANPNIVLAGAITPYDSGNRRHATVWRSTDGGSTWEQGYGWSIAADISAVTVIRFCPGDPNIVLAGLCYDNYPQYDDGPMIRSTDGGRSWEYVLWSQFGASAYCAVSAIMFDSARPGRVLAGFGDDDTRDNYGLHESLNNGATWTRLNTPPFDGPPNAAAPIFDLVQTPVAPDTIYAGTVADYYTNTSSALYRSVDGGASWTTASAPALPYPAAFVPQSVYRIAIDPSSTSTLWAVPTAPLSTGEYFGSQLTRIREPFAKTTDGGLSWTTDSQGLNLTNSSPFTPETGVQAIIAAGGASPRLVLGFPKRGVWHQEQTAPLFLSSSQGLMLSNAMSAATSVAESPLIMVAGLDNSNGLMEAVRLGANISSPWMWSNPLSTGANPFYVTQIVVNQVNHTHVAALFDSAFFRSTTGGNTWASGGISATMLAATGNPAGRLHIGGANYGLLISDDFGATSTPAVTNLNGLRPLSFDFGPAAGRINAALAPPGFNCALGGGVYVSLNDGTTFTKRNHGLAPDVSLNWLAWAGGPGERVFAMDGGAFMTSSDGGASWQGSQPAYVTPWDMKQHTMQYIADFAAASTATTRTLWMLADSHYICRSTDDGASWMAVNPSPMTTHWMNRIAVAPSDARQVWVLANDRICRTVNGGDTWTTAPAPGGLSTPVEFRAGPGALPLLAAADNSSLLMSNDGGSSWTPAALPAALVSERLSALAISPATASMILAGTHDGLWISSDGGTSWSKWGLAPSDQIAQIIFAPGNSQHVYAFDSDGVIYRSIDGGLNWLAAGQVACDYGQTGPRQLAVSASDPDILLFANSYDTLWKSVNGGADWSHASPDLENTNVLSVAANSADGNNMVAATKSHGLYGTTDGGLNWKNVMNRKWNYQALQVVANPTQAGEFLAATQWGLFRSADGGATWTPFRPELNDLPVTNVRLVPSDARVDIIATTTGHGVWTTLPWEPPARIADWVRHR